MNKAVLISIHPKFCDLIAQGKKTIEVRKTIPKLAIPFKCYIYQTLPKSGDWNERDGRVIGEFVCDGMDRYAKYGRVGDLPHYMKSSPGGYPATEIHHYSLQLTPHELEEYGKGAPLHGWHISDLVIYDKPKELNEFYTNVAPNGFGGKRVQRAPQSWIYVEERP